MRKSSDVSDTVSCSDAARLFEMQISEETLSADEARRFSRHVNDCSDCRKLVAWLAVLPAVADTPSEAAVEAARVAVLESGAFSVRSGEPRRRFRHLALATAAAGLAALGVLYLLVSARGETVDAPAVCIPAPLTSPAPGIVMTYCGERPPSTVLENSGDVRISLSRGTVGLNIDPKRPEPHNVVVAIEEGEVRVKGTLFTVGVGEHGTRVEVFRGIVEFIPRFGGPALQVAAGQGADLRGRHMLAPEDRRTADLRRFLEAETVSGVGDRLYAEKDLRTPGPSTAAPLPDSGIPDELSNGNDSSPSLEAAEKGTDPAGRKPTIDALIQEAQSCLIAHDWPCAAARYHDVLRYYPGRPESTAVLVSLAKLELRRLDAPEKALRHYKAYQRRARNGAMAEETLFGIAESYRKLGNGPLETKTLRQFIEEYPRSPQGSKARARLRLLEAGGSPSDLNE